MTPRPTTATVAIRSRALTTRRPHARTRHRKLIPHQAAAIQLRRAPTPRRAAAIQLRQALTPRRAAALAEEEAAVGVAVAAEARAAAEAPPLAGGTNPFSHFNGPSGSSGQAICFSPSTTIEIPPSLHLPSFQFLVALRPHNSSGRPVLNEVVLYRHLLFRHGENGQQMLSNDEVLVFQVSPGLYLGK